VLGQANPFQLGERLVGSVAALLLGCIDQLIQMASEEISDAVFAAWIVAIEIP
jgi:hypothetical protein